MCVVRCDMSRFRPDPLQTLESHTWLLPAALSMGSGGGETGIPDRATPKGEASWRSVAADNPRWTPSCAVCVKADGGGVQMITQHFSAAPTPRDVSGKSPQGLYSMTAASYMRGVSQPLDHCFLNIMAPPH